FDKSIAKFRLSSELGVYIKLTFRFCRVAKASTTGFLSSSGIFLGRVLAAIASQFDRRARLLDSIRAARSFAVAAALFASDASLLPAPATFIATPASSFNRADSH